MNLLPIPVAQLDSMWMHIEPIISRAVKLTPDRIASEDLFEAAKAGQYLLWSSAIPKDKSFVY